MRRSRLLLLLACACDAPPAAPPSTTTAIGPGGGAAVSADGWFQIDFAPGALPAARDIHIETLAETSPLGCVSPTYRVVEAPLLLQAQALISVRVPQVTIHGEPAVAGADFGLASPLAGSVPVGPDRAQSAERAIQARYCLFDGPAAACAHRACGEGCATCAGADCPGDQRGLFCAGDGSCRPGRPERCPGAQSGEGWDAPVGGGRMYLVNQMAIAPAGDGFDLDGRCAGGHCGDGRLDLLGRLFNDSIRHALLEGRLLAAIELDGLGPGDQGYDSSLTARLHSARDADQPADPANNFRTPAGYSRCCELRVVADPRGAAQTPARIANTQLRSSSAVPLSLPFPTLTSTGVELRLEHALLAARLSAGSRELESGVIGGVVLTRTLAAIRNPFCAAAIASCPLGAAPGGSFLDLVGATLAVEPDVDLDGDGLERVEDGDGDGRIDRCFDGCAGACGAAREVAPLEPAVPSSCAERPEMANGYSLAVEFTAVRATFAGMTQ